MTELAVADLCDHAISSSGGEWEHGEEADWKARDWPGVLPITHWLHREKATPVTQARVFVRVDADSALPSALSGVMEAIERSREITELRDDWDGEGSAGYSVETWKRATDYLRWTALSCWEQFRVAIPPPWIIPGPEGSIDLHWQAETYELLVNVPGAPEKATFYGDHRNGMFIEGRFTPEAKEIGRLALVAWLVDD